MIIKNIYLVPGILGAPSGDVLVVGRGAAVAGRASVAGAVAAAVGGEAHSAVANDLLRHTKRASHDLGGNEEESEYGQKELHFLTG